MKIVPIDIYSIKPVLKIFFVALVMIFIVSTLFLKHTSLLK
jgi:hypothetical protein